MELFIKGDGVKLRSHLDKYLVADDDHEKVRQSRNGDARRAVWTVETVADKPRLIRLRSCHGTYLTASNTPFLLGMTGEKVVQTASSPDKPMDWQTQWEPVRDGFQVKMKSWCGKWLRANGGSPPWRNSVTHDEPHTSKTKDWILWDVIAVDGDPETMSFGDDSVCSSPVSSHPDLGSDLGSPSSVKSMKSFGRLSFGLPISPRWTPKPKTNSNVGEVPAMEFFQKAKAVRMRSVHEKYLTADEDEETVAQDRNGGSSKNARWVVEPVRGSYHVIRLKSCHGNYLTASNERFLLGATGRKVVLSKPNRLDSSVEWEPLREGSKIKLRTRYGKYLRANGGVPPWRNSVTHDIPHRTATQEWILWEVDVVEILVDPHPTPDAPPLQPPSRRSSSPISRSHSGSSTPSSVSAKSDHLLGQESNESQPNSPPKSEGRTIYYHIADETGHVEDESTVGYALTFKGKSVEQLTQALREATIMDDVIVCTRSPLNGKLFPLRLQLPPNTTMHVVLVSSTSRLARELASGLMS